MEGHRSRPVQSLEVERDAANGTHRIWWVLDARKLSGSNREAVSPIFELVFATGLVQFKMILRSAVVDALRGGGSFKRAKGRGSVEVRCLEHLDDADDQLVRFRLAVGAMHRWGEEARGPVAHRFSQRTFCSLPEEIREWDFCRHVDRETHTFDVCLEILDGVVARVAEAQP